MGGADGEQAPSNVTVTVCTPLLVGSPHHTHHKAVAGGTCVVSAPTTPAALQQEPLPLARALQVLGCVEAGRAAADEPTGAPRRAVGGAAAVGVVEDVVARRGRALIVGPPILGDASERVRLVGVPL